MHHWGWQWSMRRRGVITLIGIKMHNSWKLHIACKTFKMKTTWVQDEIKLEVCMCQMLVRYPNPFATGSSWQLGNLSCQLFDNETFSFCHVIPIGNRAWLLQVWYSITNINHSPTTKVLLSHLRLKQLIWEVVPDHIGDVSKVGSDKTLSAIYTFTFWSDWVYILLFPST